MKWSAAAILVLAAVLRAPGLFTDFWLDEIWALENVSALESATGVFTGIHHDSNHWLASLWMFLLGSDEAFWVYRLPSFAAGVLVVLAAGWLAELTSAKRSLGMLLAAASFPLGFYASEARGYSLAALAGLLAAACFLRWAESGKLRFLAAYSLATALGILAHLSFLIVLAACGFLGLVIVLRGRLSFARLLALHAVPVALLAVLFAVDLRFLTLGGGPRTPPGELLLQTASLALGGPLAMPAALPFAALALLLVVAELARQIRGFWSKRERSDPGSLLWLFYAAVLLLPVWIALVLDPPFLFPRYFLVSVAFVPVLLASFVSAVSRKWATVVVACYLLAHASAWARFASEGRGRYQEALHDILTAAPAGKIAVGSDNDFRTEKIVSFYRERMGGEGERIHYVRSRAEFRITAGAEAAPESWVLVSSYPSSSLSGASWNVYRRAAATSDRSTSSPDP